MNNQDQAAQTIYHLVRNHLDIENDLSKIAATRIAQILRKENLIAPDLPEPLLGSDGALLWNNETVWIEDDEVAVYTDLPKSTSWMTPNEARQLAASLLAAANYVEEK